MPVCARHAAAKAVNLPKDKIEAAIRKGTGQDAGGDLTEIMYEGYASGGVAVIVETATDNKNRTVADVRHIFTKHGGSLGESGSVSFQFDRKGVIMLSKEKYPDEDAVMNLALEAGRTMFATRMKAGASTPPLKISTPCAKPSKGRASRWNPPRSTWCPR